MTLTPNAQRLAVELSLPVLKTWICRGWNSNTQPSACGSNAQTTTPPPRYCMDEIFVGRNDDVKYRMIFQATWQPSPVVLMETADTPSATPRASSTVSKDSARAHRPLTTVSSTSQIPRVWSRTKCSPSRLPVNSNFFAENVKH